MKSIKIDQCDDGYLVSDLELVGENGLKVLSVLSRHAISKDRLVQKIKELFGITDKKNLSVKKLHQKTQPEAKAPSTSICEDSASTITKYPSIELTTKPSSLYHPVSPTFTFSEIGAFEVSVQPVTTGKAIYWLPPGGKNIKISRKVYRSIFIYAKVSDLVYLYEHPAEVKAITIAYGKMTYGNKAIVLRGFLKDVPLSALVGDTNHDDVSLTKKEVPKGQSDGTCDDVAFETCANNSPMNCRFCIDQSRYGDKNKLVAKKPASPLLRASVPP